MEAKLTYSVNRDNNTPAKELIITNWAAEKGEGVKRKVNDLTENFMESLR